MINIVLTADDAYMPHVGVVILSILSNTNAAADIRFFIISPDLSRQNIERLKILCSAHRSSVEFPVVDHSQIRDLPSLEHFSLNAFLRLLAPEACGNIERLLYLDSDLVVLGDVQELFDAPLCDHVVGAVEQLSSNYGDAFAPKYQLNASGRYFNSGGLLFDVAQWKQEQFEEKVFRWIRENRGLLHFPDQDALNACFWNAFQPLDPRWNVEARLFKERHLGIRHEKRVVETMAHPKLIHYTGPEKPWNSKMFVPKREHYTQYANQLADRYGWDASPQVDGNSWFAKGKFACEQFRFRAGCIRNKLWNRSFVSGGR